MKTNNTKYALLLGYRGSDFHGFQAQGELKTVELSLRQTLHRALHLQPRQLVPAGRTDAGVHAVGQVVSLRAHSEISVSEWPQLFNAQAPRGIWMSAAIVVPRVFHARARTRGRSYRYLLRDGCDLSATASCDPNWAWAFSADLDLQLMRQAATLFLGMHDFSAFGYRLDPSKSAHCSVEQINIWRRAHCLVIDIRGDRFLRRMVRLMVAHLVEVGLGLLKPSSVALALTTGQRALQGTMAPARGLYLRQVRYARDDFLPADLLLLTRNSKASKAASNSLTLAEIWASIRRG